MHLKVHSIKNPDIYTKDYQKYMTEEFYEKPIPEIVKIDYSIADYMIIAFKVYQNTETGGKEIGIYTTLESIDFIVVDFDEDILNELEEIVQLNNQFFREGK